MPIYAYRCASCGFDKDHLQKLSDPVLSVCPQCGQHSYHKQLTAAGFQLKGSGWYVTDFKGGNKAPPSAAAKPESAEKAPVGDSATSSATTSAPTSATAGDSSKPSSTAGAGAGS
ncbi:MAG: zinc ribbon domain-containing protein [Candidatus Accumulibacter sp.]|uniref:FmdB family zinc ribbon protein n=1 Tax=Accumulibacter sp. TaxID=2053492 RepID=UPI0019DBAE4D|nr:zinc ribbon domain-containing protein [Accumulibacter sp.]MBE2258629.1 zinc ribbon domain-containing protein [Paracoccaceae bacterium]MCB1942509.1 zinc ribbon domain-containing protein [Accumulibacter sp.]MCP5246995.1 zinc ribbon domain-containing protein [Accumulibacter sp.]